jgi:hypothetical protein
MRSTFALSSLTALACAGCQPMMIVPATSDMDAGRGATFDAAPRDAAARDAAARDGRVGGGSEGPGEAVRDAGARDGAVPDGSFFGDASGSCSFDSCGPGFACCEDDATCQPIDCPACCATRREAGVREDARVVREDSGISREDGGLPSGADAGRLTGADAGPVLPLYDGAIGGPSCGAVVCDPGTYCCPTNGICVPTGCPECCDTGGPLPPVPGF